MESAEHVTLTTATRQERLAIHLRRNNLTFAHIGRLLGCSRGSANRLCNAETAPTRRVEQLLELGIPADLLPTPLDIAPGPKPREHQPAA